MANVKIVECTACKAQISTQAEKCPQCGHPNKKTVKPVGFLQAIGGLVVFIVLLCFFFGGGLEKQTAEEMDNANNEVAKDAVAQYQIAKRQGDKMQVCVQAGFVSAAYLQAKDEANYQQWKTIEKQDCAIAGVPS